MVQLISAFEYHDKVRARLLGMPLSPSERLTALAALGEIMRWCDRPGFTCTKTAAELSDRLGMNKSSMSRTLALLEQVGAIGRDKRGSSKLIIVTPEGPFLRSEPELA